MSENLNHAGFDEHKRRLDSYTNHRELEFDVFLEDYKKRNPPPLKTIIDPKFPKLSLKFWLALISGICAVGASGLRVYDIVYRVAYASSKNSVLAGWESVLALGAVNIGLVALAFTFAYVKRKVSDNSLFAGLIVAATISLIAGFGQSLAGLQGSQNVNIANQIVDWILAISLAMITALEWVSGDMAGVEMVLYETRKAEAMREHDKETYQETNKYQAEYKEWLKVARAQFPNWKMQFSNWEKSNFDNPIIQPSLSFASETVSVEELPDVSRKNSTKFRKQGGRTMVEQHRLETIPEIVSNSINKSTSKETILSIIDDIYSKTGETPKVTDICRNMAMRELPKKFHEERYFSEYAKSKKGYVSKIRKEWIENKSSPT